MQPNPTSFQTIADPAPAHTATSQPPDSRTVLIVDDDSAIRGFAAMMLECRGFKTVVAGNGVEALDALQQHPEVSAVLLDVLMPVMDGPQAFTEIRKSWPSVRVILISGLNSEQVFPRFGNPAPDGYLQKPFTIGKLTDALGSLLN